MKLAHLACWRYVLHLSAPAVLALACGSSARSAPQPVVARPGPSGSRYSVGDYVVYRYSGAFTPAPVVLREEIVERQGNRLVIDVSARRGSEERRWRQVVTDTPENEKNNVVDDLYEITDGERRRLTNVNNEDLYRLYSWTVVTTDGKARDVRSSRTTSTFSGATFDCERTEGKTSWRGRPIRFEAHECADFLWTHGPVRFQDEQTGDDVSRVEVLEFGRVRRP